MISLGSKKRRLALAQAETLPLTLDKIKKQTEKLKLEEVALQQIELSQAVASLLEMVDYLLEKIDG